MQLPALVALIEALPSYGDIVHTLLRGDAPATARLPDAVRPFLLAALARGLGKPLLIMTARPEDARRMQEQVAACLGPSRPVHLLPEPDALPFEDLASDPVTVQQRLRVLSAMAGVLGDSASPPLIVVASAYAVAAKTLAPEHLRRASPTLARGATVDFEALLRRWALLGYRASSAVELPGSMSRRGGIVDIYPPTSPYPVRIEMFGDVVESLRWFDPRTQRSVEQPQSVVVGPVTELLAPEDGILPALDLGACDSEAQARIAEQMRQIAEGAPVESSELYRGLANRHTALDYAAASVLVTDEPSRIRRVLEEIDAEAEELRNRLTRDRRLPAAFPAPHVALEEVNARSRAMARRLDLDAFAPDDAAFPFSAAPSFAGHTRTIVSEVQAMLSRGERVVLLSHQASRLQELLTEAGLPAVASDLLDRLPAPGTVIVLHGAAGDGWCLAGQHVTLLTDAELFGLHKQRRVLRRRPTQRQSFLSELTVGDHVVHIDHGIGRFAGTKFEHVGDRDREYLVLEYAKGDRLLVPSDQIDRVGPYVGAGEHEPTLSRLGGQEWDRMKAKAKASAATVARDLLALYAAREVVQGHACAADTPWQREMEESFPYVETPDQMRAIEDTKADMERPKPMDRLITGDVGYGKTEVALRAAFKAVMDGRQVAVLVPTTVLAQQHFNTFRERLAPFPVRVEMLSRFRSEPEQEDVVQRLALGTVDICIGTHRLLQKDVLFKNLGLVVIDEEQRFGVTQKERLKQLRREVDVLAMSATPIPRTLYMALAGARDMSIMETPPEERLPIKSYVVQYDDGMLREAILREMERGGQVFFVHNRVQSIAAVAQRLAALAPEARIIVAHGQMPEDRLEKAMLQFSHGEADVLVCTTIIESGLDMPNVNTLIVSDAGRFGLSQLYQLRGRVGRGPVRAYAYFVYHPDKRLSEIAEKRLKTILSATELGAGFKIAMKDLEIRGAGNILGAEQHGHIAAVGFDLYVRLLGEAVEELKAALAGEPAPTPAVAKRQAPSVDLPIPASLPAAYVPDLQTRLSIYQRMAGMTEPSHVDDFADEIKDRFGPWPEAVEDLLFLLKVKLLAATAGVLSVSHQTGEVILTGDERTWSHLLGVQRPYGDGVRIGHTRVRLDIKRLGKNWRAVLQAMLQAAAERRPEKALAR